MRTFKKILWRVAAIIFLTGALIAALVVTLSYNIAQL
jgi:hypothetical protein